MRTSFYAILILICCACQTGRIPCPDARGPKIQKVRIRNSNKRYPEYTASISAQREQSNTKYQAKESFVQNVSEDEWDCPRPGEKKYMPKSVKENIRKNFKRIKSGKKQQPDSEETKPNN